MPRYNSYCGDSLLDDPFSSVEKFDYVAGNPPYGRARYSGCKEKQQLYKKRWKNSQVGEFNLYRAFVEMGLNKGSILGYVIPATWISSPQGKKIRELFKKKNIVDVCYYSQGLLFEGVTQASTLIVVKEGDQKEVRLQRIAKNSKKDSYIVNDFYDLKHDCFIVSFSEESHKLIMKLLQIENTVSDNVIFKTGEVNVGTDKKILTKEKTTHPYCNGKVLSKSYAIDLSKVTLFVNEQSPAIKLKGQIKKILLQQISGNGAGNLCSFWLKGTIDTIGLIPSSNYNNYGRDNKQVLACLNSLLLNYIYSVLNDSNGVSPSSINRLPMPKELDPRLDGLVDKMLLDPNDKETEKEINKIVYELYELAEEEIKIIEEEESLGAKV